MGSTDVPPDHVPSWVVPLSTAALGVGVLCWDATYILMTRRSLQTKSYGMPLLGLALNVAWEIVYGFYVSEALLETAGFVVWLLLDVGLVYTTIKHAPYEWEGSSPWVGRHIAAILALMTAVGVAGNFTVVSWWLSEPGIGHGDKRGKWYYGRDEYDTTELAFWTAGVAQVAGSIGSLAMLLVRGHSGGTSYAIWLVKIFLILFFFFFTTPTVGSYETDMLLSYVSIWIRFCRMLGTVVGLGGSSLILWLWWPEAHGYITNPFGIFLLGTAVVTDLVYPVCLWKVRQTEITLPDGRVVSQEQGMRLRASSKKEL